MLNDAVSFINEIKNLNLSLFFVHRKTKDQSEKCDYTVYSSSVSKKIGDELFNSAKKILLSLCKNEPEYLEYGILPSSERKLVEYIPYDDVPYLNDILHQIGNSGLKQVSDQIFGSVLGYIVRIENKGHTLYLIKKNTPQKLLQKGKFFASFRDGDFQNVNSDILTLEKSFDAVLLQYEDTPDNKEKKPENLLILNKSNFEVFFDYKVYYQEEIKSHRSKIETLDFICELNGAVDYCQKHGLMVRKLARILKYQSFDKSSFSKPNIEAYITKFGVNFDFEEDGTLTLSQNNMWKLLRVLDQDYATLELTKDPVEIRSKSKI